MNVQRIAIDFADRLSRMRALNDEETDMLCHVIRLAPSERAPKLFWTSEQDRQLQRLIRKPGMRAAQIAEAMGRTPWAIRSRVRTLKARGVDIGRARFDREYDAPVPFEVFDAKPVAPLFVVPEAKTKISTARPKLTGHKVGRYMAAKKRDERAQQAADYREKGWSAGEVAALLAVSEATVRNYWKRERDHG